VPKIFKDVQKENVTASEVSRANDEGKPERSAFAARAKKSALRKTAAKKSTRRRKQATAKSRANSKHSAPSDEQIRLRAYFIAEKRAQLSLPGDIHSDWLEARRQLFEEAGTPLS
jgi:hypothetical protein